MGRNGESEEELNEAVGDDLPLAGVRVLELGHIVMGPTCGLILADMGAEVLKVEPAPKGDNTRRLGGYGAGLFHYFNRNKSSLSIDLKSERGKDVLRRAIAKSDVLIENFGPGVVDRLGFGYADCAALNSLLIYCSLKGFMPGPYETRPSLDNLVQMMGGLAYMTGPQGRPLRAGASVSDILGAAFGAIGILAALLERGRTGHGQNVTAALFESTAFLVGQHMATSAVTGHRAIPMPEGNQPWAIYDLFETRDDKQIFIGVINDHHWRKLCDALKLDALARDHDLATNEDRIAARPVLTKAIADRIAAFDEAEIVTLCEDADIPFAPVRRPDELFEDEHLLDAGSLVETKLPDGRMTRLPKLPLQMGSRGFGLRHEPPAVGEGSRAALAAIGLADSEVDRLAEDGIISLPDGRVET